MCGSWLLFYIIFLEVWQRCISQHMRMLRSLPQGPRAEQRADALTEKFVSFEAISLVIQANPHFWKRRMRRGRCLILPRNEGAVRATPRERRNER